MSGETSEGAEAPEENLADQGESAGEQGDEVVEDSTDEDAPKEQPHEEPRAPPRRPRVLRMVGSGDPVHPSSSTGVADKKAAGKATQQQGVR